MATPDATLLGVQDSLCEAVEENGEGVTMMDIEIIGDPSCPKS
jgi:hypothetical protein